jgi:predicted sugar kinase
MKNRMSFLLFPLLLYVAPMFGQQAEKTLVKSFNLNGQTAVLLDVDGTVSVTTWNEPQMRIQVTITLQNGSETMLKSLVTAGRYNLDSKELNGIYSIVAPGLERQIKLGSGQQLGETVSYTVLVPKGVTITTRPVAAAQAEASTSSF